MDMQIQQLMQKKKTIEEEIKKRKDINKKESSHNESLSNVLKRVSTKFFEETKNINQLRDENGDNIISHPKITELIIKHKLWNNIKADIINFKLKVGKIGNE